MHDLVNDLAQFVSGEFCCKFEDGKSGGFSGKTRHFACLADHLDGPEKFVALQELKSLRTFLPLSFSNSSYNLSTTVSDVWLPILKHLRVLSLSCYKITKLPDSLGGLIYLRYLDLSQTLITELPSSTCSLYNLQTLLLSRCRNLNVLPANSFGQLIHLRHLDLSQTLISELPSSTCSLYNLQTLLLSRCHHLTALPANSLDQLIHLRYLDLSQTLIGELPSSTCSLYNLQTLLLSGCTVSLCYQQT
jgi:Leucine-rich repeat (LRR) protein